MSSVLLGCGAASVRGWTFDPLSWDHSAVSKRQGNYTQWRGALFEKDEDFNFTAANI